MAHKDNGIVTLLAVGDIGTNIEPADKLAELVLPALREGDLRFGQCESIYTERPIVPPDPNGPHGEAGMMLSPPAHPRLASIWKTTGMDIISLASNHTMDAGAAVLMDTVELFRAMGKHVIGAGKDIEEARKPAIVEYNGVKIAFLGYCSVLPDNCEAGKNKAGIAPMRARTYYERGGDPHEDYQPGTPPRILTVPNEEDLQALQNDIRKAKQQADVVVMSIHWGIHHLPKVIATYQPVVAHAAIDAGADLILGHHPHCLKAVEVYKGKVCFYSLGNFMLPGGHKKHHYWDLYYYHVDPEGLRPEANNRYPLEDRYTVIAKVIFSKNGVKRISFLPAFINPYSQPAVVEPSDPRFQEIVNYTDWLSEHYPHNFRVDGKEVVVDTLT